MRVKAEDRDFIPISLILETQEEVDKFMAIFEHTGLTYALNINNWYELLEDYSDEENYDKWWEKINDLVEGE